MSALIICILPDSVKSASDLCCGRIRKPKGHKEATLPCTKAISEARVPIALPFIRKHTLIAANTDVRHMIAVWCDPNPQTIFMNIRNACVSHVSTKATVTKEVLCCHDSSVSAAIWVPIFFINR